MFVPAKDIDEVIERLDIIIDWAKAYQSRLGYFPILYREVTVAVKVGIQKGRFEDGPRMERLDVIFANRYLEAWHQYRLKDKPSRAWEIAFRAGKKRRLTVLHHLLLGINAHINLDLGIAAAQTVEHQPIDTLGDFEEINQLLFEMVGQVQSRLNKVSPLMNFVDRMARKLDEKLARFSLQKARENAWRVATEYCTCEDQQEQAEKIKKEDIRTSAFATLVKGPGMLSRLLILLIQFSEVSKNPRQIMQQIQAEE
ncbi:MAG: DUF5995 family protein [Bacteroidota bacterium]